MLTIRKNDIVVCRKGKDRGKKGKVLSIFPKQKRAVVEGINLIKRHTRKTREDRQGGIIQKESSVHISNLMPLCNKCNKPIRVNFSLLKNNTKTRICKKCKEAIG